MGQSVLDRVHSRIRNFRRLQVETIREIKDTFAHLQENMPKAHNNLSLLDNLQWRSYQLK